jgi:hypothetical protein
MPTAEGWTLWLHVAAGVVALLSGIGALATAKGGPWHRRAGRSFVVSMGVVVGTVVPLLAFDPTPFRVFLTLVAVFSGYLAFSGYRVLSRKRPTDEPQAVDWFATAGVVLACAGLGGWGLSLVRGGDSFGLVMVVFGGIGLVFGVGDVWTFRTGGRREVWTVSHLQRMIAAFIATVSAVSAVNLADLLGVVAWLWPTIVGTPLIVYWARKYDSG